MPEALPLSVIIPYSLFSLFIFCQQYHVKHFRGASQIYPVFLSLTGVVGLVAGTVFLVYYGVKVSWWAPFAIVAIGFLFKMMAHPLINHFAPLIGMAGIIGWPICAAIMFFNTPDARHDRKAKESISAFIEMQQHANSAAAVISAGNAYSLLGDSNHLSVAIVYANAVLSAESVNTKVLNREYPGWGDHFADDCLTGLRMARDGHLNGDTQKILAADMLLAAWQDWYNANMGEIKKQGPKNR